jgi:hypothetical protein
MHHIAPNIALVDLTLKNLEKYKELVKSVTVVLVEQKAVLVSHFAKWRHVFHIRFVFFNDSYHEWAGSILSAEPEFTGKNVVMLPDTRMIEHPEHPLLPTFSRLLDDNEVVLAFKPVPDGSEVLRALGAVTVAEDGKVARFADKPVGDLAGFNGYWTSFGFTEKAGRPLLELMMRSIKKEPVSLDTVSQRVAAFPVQDYLDLGTWPNMKTPAVLITFFIRTYLARS